METYIKDLNLSPEVKTALSWCLGITKVSDLEGLNYLTFANRCPKNYNVLAIGSIVIRDSRFVNEFHILKATCKFCTRLSTFVMTFPFFPLLL